MSGGRCMGAWGSDMGMMGGGVSSWWGVSSWGVLPGGCMQPLAWGMAHCIASCQPGWCAGCWMLSGRGTLMGRIKTWKAYVAVIHVAIMVVTAVTAAATNATANTIMMQP